MSVASNDGSVHDDAMFDAVMESGSSEDDFDEDEQPSSNAKPGLTPAWYDSDDDIM